MTIGWQGLQFKIFCPERPGPGASAATIPRSVRQSPRNEGNCPRSWLLPDESHQRAVAPGLRRGLGADGEGVLATDAVAEAGDVGAVDVHGDGHGVAGVADAVDVAGRC